MKGTNKPTDTRSVFYTGTRTNRLKSTDESLSVIGIDTEAYSTGECFMIATSLGDVFTPAEFLAQLQKRKYRDANFVAYNLKYDEGALLQILPDDKLRELWETDSTHYKEFRVRVIPRKMLAFSRGHKTATFYDMLNFYNMSLEQAASRYLGEHKIDVETKQFTPEYVQQNWSLLAEYCVQDAQLVQRLAEYLIRKFETFNVYPRRLFSVAYVSYQHFRRECHYPTVYRYWHDERDVLDKAMGSYNGGKFEVTEKGCDYYYEYDIVSAYPYEIRNLIDVTHARVVHSSKYRRQAVYGFLDCHLSIPVGVYSPCVVKRGYVNTYPVGEYDRTITKAEYEYLTGLGCDISIKDGVWLHIDNRQYPFRKQIDKLIIRKQQAKKSGDDLDYHTAKILMNSLYGKFVQLILTEKGWKAGASWNPIYGATITANTRIRISELQQQYPSIVAVHTDSVISTAALPFGESDTLGSLSYECEGDGLILGSGIYQIGDKVRFRGFSGNFSLFALTSRTSKKAPVPVTRPITWRETAFHNWDHDLINRFTEQPREINLNFDQKRVWLDDWHRFSDIPHRKVTSVPLIVCPALW